jgi:hypothetical protein
MPSKIQVDQIAGATGSTVTLPSGQTLDLSSGTVNLPSASLSALNATNLTSGTVPSARLSLTSSDLPTVPTTKGGTGLTTIGTAAQVLRVNSGATGLEFATPAVASSDFVKLHSSGAVSGNTISVDGYFSATYKNYIVKVLGLRSTTFAGNRFNLRVNTGGSSNSSSLYAYCTSYNASGSATGNWSYGHTETLIDLGYHCNNSSTEDAVSSFTLNFFDPQNTSNFKPLTYEGLYFDQSSTAVSQDGAGSFRSTTALTGFTFGAYAFSGSGTLYIDDIIIYGLK